MFAQMKSGSGGPDRSDTKGRDHDLKLIMLVFLVMVGLLILVWKSADHSPPHVMVDGEKCDIVFHRTGITSWGSARGYYETVCPSHRVPPP